jgi:ketosteroid isomerase-like protein
LSLNSDTAKAIVESAHAAWNAGSVEGVLDKYVDDLIYVSNIEGANGEPLTIYGKEAFRAQFMPVMAAVESKTSIDGFHFQGGIARVRLSAFVRHRTTGHLLTGSFRQIMHFRGFQICKLEDFHDAAKVNAFWRLVWMDAARSFPARLPPKES